MKNWLCVFVILGCVFEFSNAQKPKLVTDEGYRKNIKSWDSISEDIKSIDPRQFVRVYQQTQADRYAYLAWELGYLRSNFTIDKNSRLYVDFDVNQIINARGLNGQLSIKAKLGNRDIPVYPYYTLGQSQSVIGNAGYYSIDDFVTSLIGLLSAVDAYQPRLLKNGKQAKNTYLSDGIDTSSGADLTYIDDLLKSGNNLHNDKYNMLLCKSLIKELSSGHSDDDVLFRSYYDTLVQRKGYYYGSYFDYNIILWYNRLLRLQLDGKWQYMNVGDLRKALRKSFVADSNNVYKSALDNDSKENYYEFKDNLYYKIKDTYDNELQSITGYLTYFNHNNLAPFGALSRALERDPVLIENLVTGLSKQLDAMTDEKKKLDDNFNDESGSATLNTSALKKFNIAYKEFLQLVKSFRKINKDVMIPLIGEKLGNDTVHSSLKIGDKISVSDEFFGDYFEYRINKNFQLIAVGRDQSENHGSSFFRFYDFFKTLDTDTTKQTIRLADILSYNGPLLDSIKDDLIIKTRRFVYKRLIPATIDVNSENPNEGDDLTIYLMWIDPHDVLDANAVNGQLEIPLVTFKVKETGWKVKVSESFFLINNLNPDENNPHLSKSIFKGAAGVSLFITYSSVNNGYSKKKVFIADSVYFGRRKINLMNNDPEKYGYDRKGFLKFMRSLEPSLGLNVCYLSFDNTKEFEVGLGLAVGLFRNSIQFTGGYDLNLKPSNHNFYCGVGFSFINIAEKIKSLTTKP